MDVAGITTTADFEGDTKAVQSKNKLADDLDSFLFILTTQLKNQDPLSPMDSTEFTNQLVQFSNVEQNIHTNEHLEDMINLSQTNLMMSSVGYIGKNVEMNSNEFPLQDGEAKFRYTLDNSAEMCTIAVTDDSGKIVHSIVGNTDVGDYLYEWDGKDSQGEQLPDGQYKLSITALSLQEGQTVNTTITSFGRVNSITNDENSTLLGFGDMTVDVGKVISVCEI